MVSPPRAVADLTAAPYSVDLPPTAMNRVLKATTESRRACISRVRQASKAAILARLEFFKRVALLSAPSAKLQAASSTPTALDMIATGKAECGTGILIVHTVPFSESTFAVPRTCSTRRRTKPSPCRLLSA